MNDLVLDLQNLLQFTLHSTIKWLSEKPKAEIPVHWVVLSAEDIQAGDIVLLSAPRMKQDLIDTAYQRKAAAVLLIGDIMLQQLSIPQSLPVAVIPEISEIRSVQIKLIKGILSKRELLMERGLRIYSQLSKLVAEGAGLEGIAGSIAEISGHGLLIQDKRMRILADCPSASLSGVWSNVLLYIVSLELLPEDLHDRKKAGQEAAIIIQEVPGNLVRLVTPIIVGEIARGYLSLICQDGEIDELDHLVISQAASICAIEMSRIKSVREVEKRLQGDLLDALLQDNLSPRDAGLWMQTMDMDENAAHLALRFTWDGSPPPTRRRLETIINGEISRRNLKIVYNSVAGEAVCFCQVTPNLSRPEIAIEFAQAVISQGKEEYPQIPIRCGIGKPALEFYDWRISFRQAGQALELARRLRGVQPFYFPDLSVFRLLLQLEHSPEMVAFLEETLGPLLENENANELINTLETYFQHISNVSQTAQALFIHRNTLTYRLEKISRIMNINLDNPETNLAVQLALHIYRMMGAKIS